jgi:hypothetical protein
MLTIENGFVKGFDLYSHRENLKFYKCKWDNEEKQWRAPDNTRKLQAYLDKVNEAEKEQINKVWNEAIDKLGLDKFKVKKGTPEYEQTRTEFKNLLKLSREQKVVNN